MAERLIEKLDRLGAEAGIKQMTPEVYRFALDVRKDLVSEWPKHPWVGLTDEERNDCLVKADPCECLADPEAHQLMVEVEAKLRSKNNA